MHHKLVLFGLTFLLAATLAKSQVVYNSTGNYEYTENQNLRFESSEAMDMSNYTKTIGTKVYEDGVYTGELIENDVRYGYGKFNYSDGDVYEGEWSWDMKQGNGKLTYSDGSFYEGRW